MISPIRVSLLTSRRKQEPGFMTKLPINDIITLRLLSLSLTIEGPALEGNTFVNGPGIAGIDGQQDVPAIDFGDYPA